MAKGKEEEEGRWWGEGVFKGGVKYEFEYPSVCKRSTIVVSLVF
jgi:hypothetical protein